MTSYLASLAARRMDERATVILWEVADAFAEADASTLPARALRLHELVRFCRFDSIAPWLRDEHAALGRVRGFARAHGQEELAGLLDRALAGTPCPPPSFSVTLPGRVPQPLDLPPASDATRRDGKDWSGTDIAIAFAMEGFEEAVLDALVAAADAFELAAPLAVRRRRDAAARIADAAAGHDAAGLLRALTNAPTPTMELGSWEQYEQRATASVARVPLQHVGYPPADAARIAMLAGRYGPAATELLAMLAVHDGATLFGQDGSFGFVLASSDEWDVLLGQAIEWAETVTWQDDPGSIPPYLRSAIAFGLTPGDSERWLLVTEGEHAGKVMLSDTDVIEDSPRYTSMTHFMATLVDDSASILNNGGYVSYLVDGESLVPLRYRGG